jgi:adenylosuccinate lyase
MTTDYETYQSPFTWRYGSSEMRKIWSEVNKRLLWRRLWVVLAEVQAEFGLVQPEQLEDLRLHQDIVSVPRALEIEAEIHHDLMAELMVFAEQCPKGGGSLHLGATSMDIEDNADVLRQRASLDLVLAGTAELLRLFADKIDTYADLPVIALPTCSLPSLPRWVTGWHLMRRTCLWTAGVDSYSQRAVWQGFTGASVLGASYAGLIGAEKLAEFETRLSGRMGLVFFPVTTQVYLASRITTFCVGWQV